MNTLPDNINPTSEILDNCRLVDGSSGADTQPVTGHSTQLPIHPADGKEDPSPRRLRHTFLPLRFSSTPTRHPSDRFRFFTETIYNDLDRLFTFCAHLFEHAHNKPRKQINTKEYLTATVPEFDFVNQIILNFKIVFKILFLI